ncbi:hypothetical protein [Streptomyces sp. NPDC001070]
MISPVCTGGLAELTGADPAGPPGWLWTARPPGVPATTTRRPHTSSP